MITKKDFLLNEDICFLNHGSYGACPKIIFDKYQEWQKLLEYQPVDFFLNKLLPEIKKSREVLGEFINTDSENLILITNATYAINLIIKSLDLKKGDELILTNHEYGACLNAWEFWQKEKGFSIKLVNLELPFGKTNAILKAFENKITENTKLIFFSHITSFTAQIFPAKEICQLALKHNIISVVDGAHGIGHYKLNMEDMNPDFYYSNIHKWLYAPKGTSFIYTKKSIQHLVKPLIVGWGWGSNKLCNSGEDYIDNNEFYGTSDLSSYLVIDNCIKFYHINNILDVKKSCNSLLIYLLGKVEKITLKKSLYNSLDENLMMAVFEIPKKYSKIDLKQTLLENYKIEVPVLEWEDKMLIRVSVQVYNTKEDIDYLLDVLRKLF